MSTVPQMPVPQPNLYPPFNIVRLSHVEFGVTDLARSRAFYVDTLGLQVTDETADTIYLRAMEVLGVEAGECIAYEDSPSGIAAAHAAGLYTIAFTGSIVVQDRSSADELIDRW